MFDAATICRENGNHPEEMRLYQLLDLEVGNAIAKIKLGEMYENGFGVKQDMKQAADLYRQAHEAGDADATYNLGEMYEHGRGVKQDTKQAAACTGKRTRQGNVAAKRKLSFVYGAGVKQKTVQKPKTPTQKLGQKAKKKSTK